MPSVLDFASNAGLNRYTVGNTAIAANDAVVVDAADLAFSAQVTDYAAVSPVGQIVAQTAVGTGGRTQGLNQRQGVLVEPVRGDIYIVFPDGSQGTGDGLRISRYSSAGALLNSVVIDNTTVAALADAQIILLSNNSVLVVARDGGISSLRYIIFDAYLNVVKVLTTIEASEANFAACALSGGGFAVNYLKQSTATQRIAIYTNTGGTTLAPTTWQTWTGTSGAILPNIGQLSNGNILLSCSSAYTTTGGLYFAIYNTAGAQQVAPTQASSTTPSGGPSMPPPMSILTGFFAIGYKTNATANKVLVYSNAGSVQGAATTQTTTASANFTFDVINDGTQFYLVWSDSSGFFYLTIQTSGTASSATTITTTSASNTAPFCVFYERGRLVFGIIPAGTGQQRIAVFNPSTNVLEMDATNFGVSPTTNTSIIRILPGGDFSFIAGLAYDTSVAFYIGKYSPSAIVGATAFGGAASGTVLVKVPAGGSMTNKLKGSTSKTFDHSAATPHGNKGTISLNGLNVSGM